MRFLGVLLLIFGFSPAFAVSLLSYNVYERTDRVDIMLSFDAPYQGQIYSKRENNTTSLILAELSFNETIHKQINSQIINELSISPIKSSISISLSSNEPIVLSASKTTDGFGLRIRATSKQASTQAKPVTTAQTQITEQASSTIAQEKDEDFIGWRYMVVIGFLCIMLIGLLVFKKYILNGGNGSMLSKRSAFLDKLELKHGVETIYERALDGQNKVVLLEHNSHQYLVLVGSTNILLDRFGKDIDSEDDFSAVFEQNRNRISAMLAQRKNSLDSYKDKISKTSSG